MQETGKETLPSFSGAAWVWKSMRPRMGLTGGGGGMIGAALASTGDWTDLRWGGLGWILLFIFLAPLIGWLLGLVIAVVVNWAFRLGAPRRIDSVFRRGQLLSAALFSLGHGGNDAQKTMGIIVALLIAAGTFPSDIQLSLGDPRTLWIILGAHVAMGIGTALGGWRIVRTMGMRLTKLRPVGGFCAETAGALTLFMVTHLGIPVSTTHTITGSIVGVGATRGVSAVKWGVAGRIVWAWIFTIPAAGMVGAAAYFLTRPFHP